MVALVLRRGVEKERIRHRTPLTILIQVNFRRREAMHTIEVLALGLVLLGGFVWIGRALGNGSRSNT